MTIVLFQGFGSSRHGRPSCPKAILGVFLLLAAMEPTMSCAQIQSSFWEGRYGGVPYYATGAQACAQQNPTISYANGLAYIETYTLGALEAVYNISPSEIQSVYWCNGYSDQYPVSVQGAALCAKNPLICAPATQMNAFAVSYWQVSTPPEYWVVASNPAMPEACTANCVADPVNPGTGAVYLAEADIRFNGAGTLSFGRFYNSADASGADGVPGWRHTYDRYVQAVYSAPSSQYPGVSSTVSPQYSSASTACTSGFTAIQSAVPAWAGAISGTGKSDVDYHAPRK
jgi:hypothetical protein